MAHKHQEQEDEEGEERRHPKPSRNSKESVSHVFSALGVLKYVRLLELSNKETLIWLLKP